MGFFQFLASALLIFFLLDKVDAAELKGINFYQKGNISYFVFELDKVNVDVRKFDNKEDKQIIIDFEKTNGTKRVLRGFDASEFDGSVVY